MTNQPQPSFEQQLDRMVENLFDELATDLERVQKGKDTALEYAQNVVATGEHFEADVLAAHNQAIAPAVQTAEAAAAVQLRKDNDFIRMVKREAVREFAERVKTEYEIIPNDVPFDMDKFVDYVVRASQLGEHKE